MEKTFSLPKSILIAVTVIFILSISALIISGSFGSESSKEYSKTSILDLTEKVTEKSHSTEKTHNSEEASPENMKFNEVVEQYFSDSSKEASMIVDQESSIIKVNKSFMSLIEKTSEQITETNFYELINSEDLPGMVSVFTKTFRDGATYDAVGPVRFKSGDSELLVLLTIKPIYNEEKVVTNILIQIRDITDLVKDLKEPTNFDAEIQKSNPTSTNSASGYIPKPSTRVPDVNEIEQLTSEEKLLLLEKLFYLEKLNLEDPMLENFNCIPRKFIHEDIKEEDLLGITICEDIDPSTIQEAINSSESLSIAPSVSTEQSLNTTIEPTSLFTSQSGNQSIASETTAKATTASTLKNIPKTTGDNKKGDVAATSSSVNQKKIKP